MSVDDLFHSLEQTLSTNDYQLVCSLFLGTLQGQGGGWTAALANYYANLPGGPLVVDLPPEEWQMLQVLPAPYFASVRVGRMTMALPTSGQLLLWTAWSRGLSPRVYQGLLGTTALRENTRREEPVLRRPYRDSLAASSEAMLILRFEPICFPEQAGRPFGVETLHTSAALQTSFPECHSVDEICDNISRIYTNFNVVVDDALRAVPIDLPALTNVTFAAIVDEMARRLHAVWDWFDETDPVSGTPGAEAVVVPIGATVELEYRMPCQFP